MSARPIILSIICALFILALSPQASRAEECSGTIVSFSPAGHGLSGKETIYLVTLNVDPDVTNAQFVVHFGATSPSAIVNTSVAHNKSSNVTGWSWIRLSPPADTATLSLVSVTKFGESQPCIPAPAQPTSITASEGAETIYDDAHPHADLADSTTGQEVTDDAAFVTKAAPEYPYVAKENGVIGGVTVEIEVGPEGGSPLRAWVRSATATYGIELLTNPALVAARRSTFTPPLFDGRPVTRSYFVSYTFSLENGPLRVSDEFNGCPLAIDGTRAVPPTGADPNAWYFFDVSATSGNIVSATIAIRDQEGRIARYPWLPLALAGPTNEERYSTASAAFNWPKTDIREIWVDQVVTSTGVTIQCDPSVDEPETISSAVGSTRFISGKALDILGLQPTPRALFVHEVLPGYPKGADGTRAAGHVTVNTLVDATGHVVDAFVTSSSGLDNLDTAAMIAALASTYQPASKGAVRAYELTYRFVP